ncbi:hypothetical protein ILUMI_04464 [Ignelater luminosus]|uniref:Lipase n=1 Tax=Ignelater luminosus TaxID=2038154 RepID=A0A8K0DCV3_IGNLU|nr:hypothetical protein ILUMI_04464 [Ignelater luminosus]
MRWILFSAIVVIILSLYLFKGYRNNVCKTFSDYYTNTDHNENCYYNPDAHLKVDEIVKRRGYPVEVHNITTEDGYIITVFRIPFGKKKPSIKEKARQPVFLLHGGVFNSESYINIGNKSLGFLLVDAGYDVWLGTFRGTKYARNHKSLSTTERDFWNFSFHEMGIYDIPAQIDLVSDITKQEIIYIGYSLGATNAFVYGVTYPETARKKIKAFICLAPAAFLYEWKSPTKHILRFWSYIEPIAEYFTNGILYLRLPHKLRSILCLPYPFQMDICQFVDMLLWGFDYEQSDPETLPITLIQNSDAISIKTFSHISQLVINGRKFQQFDYGQNKNKEMYGTKEPPIYNLTEFRVPVYLIRSENDFLVTKENIEKLNSSLPEKVKPYDIYVVRNERFNHGDFVIARDVVPLLYNHILDIITKF